MKRLIIASLLTLITAGTTTLGFASNASAGTNSPRIDRREANQQRRINQGVRSGSLTPRETYRLQRRQANINAQEARFKSDGHFTRRERNIVRHSLDRSSRAIYRAKHNGRHY
jgi:hypothetical protein